jgi:uncharacterized membrane protein
LRCPKCETTNSEFAVSCLKCGQSFVEEQKYEEFKPDYAVAYMPAKQKPEEMGPRIDYGLVKKWKKRGLILITVGIILIVLGVLFVNYFPSIGTKTPKDFDNWAQDAKAGDSVQVIGEIESNEPSGDIYVIKLDGSKKEIYCRSDLGEKGDSVNIIIKKNELGEFEVTNTVNTSGLILISLIPLIVGILLIVFGALQIRKSGLLRQGKIQAPASAVVAQPPAPAAPAPAQAPQQQPVQQAGAPVQHQGAPAAQQPVPPAVPQGAPQAPPPQAGRVAQAPPPAGAAPAPGRVPPPARPGTVPPTQPPPGAPQAQRPPGAVPQQPPQAQAPRQAPAQVPQGQRAGVPPQAPAPSSQPQPPRPQKRA